MVRRIDQLRLELRIRQLLSLQFPNSIAPVNSQFYPQCNNAIPGAQAVP
jgi:hypothetical protein